MEPTPQKVVQGISLDAELLTLAKEVAKANDRSLSNYIMTLVRADCERRGYLQPAATPTNQEEVDDGN